VADQLAGMSRSWRSSPVHDVVQAALQDWSRFLAGHTRFAGGFLVVAMELRSRMP